MINLFKKNLFIIFISLATPDSSASLSFLGFSAFRVFATFIPVDSLSWSYRRLSSLSDVNIIHHKGKHIAGVPKKKFVIEIKRISSGPAPFIKLIQTKSKWFLLHPSPPATWCCCHHPLWFEIMWEGAPPVHFDFHQDFFEIPCILMNCPRVKRFL